MSLYLKYRPNNFSSLVGQDYIRQTIVNSVKKDLVAHAYLFCGTRGTGKTSTARILAKVINCENLLPEGEPCTQCKICIAIEQGRLVDLIEIDGASNRGIDEIRELKENIQFAPSQSKKKIYIIDEVHSLTKDAFNALLKTLEEPPEHAHFVLATTESHKIPETIISRCQRFDFKRIKITDIVKRLAFIAEKEGFEFETNALELIAKQANGGLRDAIGLLEQMASEGSLKYDFISQNLGLVGKEHIREFYQNLLERNTQTGLLQINKLIENSYNLVEFNRELIEFLRETLLAQIADNQPHEKTIEIIEVFTKVGQELKTVIIPQLPLEIAVIKLCHLSEYKEENKKDKKSFFDTFAFSSENKKEDLKAKSITETLEAEQTNLDQESKKDTPKKENPLKQIPEFNLETIKENWQRIADYIPTAFVKVSFKTSQPIKAENKTLTIAFQSEFNKQKLNDSASKNEVLIALEKVFEQPIKLELTDLMVKLQPTIPAKKTNSEEEKKHNLNEVVEEIFTFID